MTVVDHETGAVKRREEVDREVEALRRSISATRTHGILYYLLLVTIMFIGFAIGYATHSLVGAAIIVIGLALVAWRETTGFKARKTVIGHVLSEKVAEQRQLEKKEKEFDSH
jgi:hypothetical protein